MRMQFTCTGVTPLLMHADNIEFADELDRWRKHADNRNQSKPGDDRSPAWSWIGSLYHDGEHVGVPAENLQKCLSQAGARVILKKQKTFKEMAVSGLWLESDCHPLEVNKNLIPVAAVVKVRDELAFPDHLAFARKLGFDLFMKRVVIGQKKHIRIRPIFRTWAFSGFVEATEKELTPAVVGQLFEIAGRIGLGDWRPGGKTPGRYGMFSTVVKPVK